MWGRRTRRFQSTGICSKDVSCGQWEFGHRRSCLLEHPTFSLWRSVTRSGAGSVPVGSDWTISSYAAPAVGKSRVGVSTEATRLRVPFGVSPAVPLVCLSGLSRRSLR